MRFSDSQNTLHVDFLPLAIETLEAHQQRRCWQNERGGVLLASSVGATDGVVVIAQATPPHRSDCAGRHWLKLDHERILREIRSAFELGLHFVGYWHTHPQVRPLLSSQDVASIVPAVQKADLDLQRLLMVVVGGRKSMLALDVCVVECTTGKCDRLTMSIKGSVTGFANRNNQVL